MEVALREITLVLFTTLAPCGAISFVLGSIVLLFFKLQPATAIRFTQFLILPLLISILGLIASATHLGSPSNALYAFGGIGRSPLSNEVAAAVVFLFISGTYWLASFSNRVPKLAERIWLIAASLSALVFIHFVAFAYATHTIITWDTLYSVVILWTLALTGGALLCLLSITATRLFVMRVDKQQGQPLSRYCLVLLAISLASFLASMVVLLQQMEFFATTGNSYGSALEQFPWYELFLILYAFCIAVGLALAALPFIRKGKLDAAYTLAGTVFVLLGVFLTRFLFYATHMTSGL